MLPDGRRVVVAFQFRKASGGTLQGAGDYSLSAKNVGVVVNLIDEDGIEANGQQWIDFGIPGATSPGAVATTQLRPDGSGTFSLNGLKPRPENPAIQGPINATFSWSCFEPGTPLPG